MQNQIRKLIVEEIEITSYKEISRSTKAFYKTLFKINFSKTNVKRQQFFNSLSTKTLTNEQNNLLENKIIVDSMKNMINNKTPGNDILTKEFYETFLDQLKTPLMIYINQFFLTNISDISQRQIVIKLIEIKDRDKRYIKNWRRIFFLSVDTKV